MRCILPAIECQSCLRHDAWSWTRVNFPGTISVPATIIKDGVSISPGSLTIRTERPDPGESKPAAPNEPSPVGFVGCVKRTNLRLHHTIGAFHAPDEDAPERTQQRRP